MQERRALELSQVEHALGRAHAHRGQRAPLQRADQRHRSGGRRARRQRRSPHAPERGQEDDDAEWHASRKPSTHHLPHPGPASQGLPAAQDDRRGSAQMGNHMATVATGPVVRPGPVPGGASISWRQLEPAVLNGRAGRGASPRRRTTRGADRHEVRTSHEERRERGGHERRDAAARKTVSSPPV